MNDANQSKLQDVAEAMRLIDERNRIKASMLEFWSTMFPTPATTYILNVLVRHVQKSGEEAVRNWITEASINELPVNQVLKYIEAIRPKKDLEDDY